MFQVVCGLLVTSGFSEVCPIYYHVSGELTNIAQKCYTTQQMYKEMFFHGVCTYMARFVQFGLNLFQWGQTSMFCRMVVILMLKSPRQGSIGYLIQVHNKHQKSREKLPGSITEMQRFAKVTCKQPSKRLVASDMVTWLLLTNPVKQWLNHRFLAQMKDSPQYAFNRI